MYIGIFVYNINMYEYTCKQCGITFFSKYKNKLYCSLQCHGKSRIGSKRPESEKKKISDTMKKYKRTKEHQENNTKSMPRGEKHHSWKGGKRIGAKGYILVHRPNHPKADRDGYVQEHRLVIEKHLGRYLLNSEVVHHINMDVKDNMIENLLLFSSSGEHTRYHHEINRLKSL